MVKLWLGLEYAWHWGLGLVGVWVGVWVKDGVGEWLGLAFWCG